jgi:hypothetical protein
MSRRRRLERLRIHGESSRPAERLFEALTGNRRDDAVSGNLAHPVVEKIGDIQVAGGIRREAANYVVEIDRVVGCPSRKA